MTLVETVEDPARIELEGAALVLCPSPLEVMGKGASVLRLGISVDAEDTLVANAGPGNAGGDVGGDVGGGTGSGGNCLQ